MAVYLIHATVNGKPEHYVGSAQDERLWVRLREHLSKPTSMFKRWRAKDAIWGVSRVWWARGQDTEEAIKACKGHRAFCPARGCAGRRARSTRGLTYPNGAYWRWRAASHGKGISTRTITRHKRLRRMGIAIPVRHWEPPVKRLQDGYDCVVSAADVAAQRWAETALRLEPGF